MKTKTARKIAESAANGIVHPVHVLRAAARQLGRPIVTKSRVGDFTYFPKGLHGTFVRATLYRTPTGERCYRESILPAGSDLSAYKDRNGYVRDLGLVAGQHRLDVQCGCDVAAACRVSASLARVTGMRVPFNFNGAEVVARPNSRVIDLYDGWHAEMDRKRQEYEASDEYKQMVAQQKAENERDQAIIDGLLSTLDEAVKDKDTLLRWLSDFAAVADNVNMNYPRQAINDTLKAAGYVANAFVGKKEEIAANKDAEALYIIGQAISCMDSGMPPHPVLITFVKRYFGEAEEAPVYEDEVEEEVEVEA